MGKIILDNMAMQRALTRITYEIVEKNKGVEDLVLMGLKPAAFSWQIELLIGFNSWKMSQFPSVSWILPTIVTILNTMR